MNMPFYRKCHAALALLWLLLVLALGLALALRTQQGPMFDSDLLSLLPSTQADAGVQQAVDAVSARLRQQVVFVISTRPPVDAVAAADQAVQGLQQSGLFETLQYRISGADQSALAAAYFPHRFGLLTDTDRAALQHGELTPLLERAFHDLVNPLFPLNAELLQADPLQLFTHFAIGLTQSDSRLRLHNGVLEYRDDQQHAVQIVATLKDGAFDTDNHDRYAQLLESTRAQLARDFSGAQLLTAGVINHASAASHTARNEINLIGTGSTLGVVLLMLVTFRSLRPLWLSLLVIGVGLMVALSLSLLLFGRVHVMTLIFGASLIGVLDYSLHFLVENSLVEHSLVENSGDTAHHGADPWHCLHLVWPGLALSMATNVLAYLAMLLAPFPGLRQIAVFSALGLSAACISVLLWFPYLLLQAGKSRPLHGWSMARWWLDCWDRAPRAILYLLLAAIAVLAFWIARAPVDDDIKRLQHVPPALAAQESAVQALAGIGANSQFFLVRGDSLQQVLQREEMLRARLDPLVGNAAGAIVGGYQALSKALPSLARQRENRQLLLHVTADGQQQIAAYGERIGLGDTVLPNYLQQLQAPPQWISTEALLGNPAFAWRHLLLDKARNKGAENVASVVLLSGVHDLAVLRELAAGSDGVTLVDHVGSISALLGQYRQRALLLAAAAYALALLGLSWRYGWRNTTLVLCPPALSALIALTISSALALPINLFNTLALLVIMGVGIDYTLFFAENRSARGSTMMSVILACITTELSFGLLALSETPVVRSFGLTMCIGIGCALLLSPLAGARAFRDDS